MSEMIERVARAIAGAVGREELPFDLEMARAAIEAMREPSEEMVNAANALDEVSKGVLITPIPERAWQAMIDAALGEKP